MRVSSAVIEVNPDALDIAAQLDRERDGERVRGPLHGIPFLVKDVRSLLYNVTMLVNSASLTSAPERSHQRQDADDGRLEQCVPQLQSLTC